MTKSFRHTLAASLAASLAALALMGMAGCATTAPQASTVSAVSAQMAELSTFNRLIQQAGLRDTVDNGEVTVFAPTDDAFKAVPAATMNQLAQDPALLKSVLSFHVLPGKFTAARIDGPTQVTTLQGGKLSLSKAGDYIVVEEGMVTTADVPAGPGIIHVVDRVLMPQLKK